MTVYINGQVIFDQFPTHYNIATESINFSLSYPPAVSELTFCAKGKSESLGATIDNVKLFYLDECKNVQAPGLPFPSVPTPPPLPTWGSMPPKPKMPTMPSGWWSIFGLEWFYFTLFLILKYNGRIDSINWKLFLAG